MDRSDPKARILRESLRQEVPILRHDARIMCWADADSHSASANTEYLCLHMVHR